MIHPRRFPRLLGHWIHGDPANVEANVWEITKGQFIAVVYARAELIEAVDASDLDGLLSYLTSTHGDGALLPAAPIHRDSDSTWRGASPTL